jgi:uncharacterized protein (DUF1786 family)
MSRYLCIDIGAGTMDVLYYDDQTELHYKAVVKSPARDLAERAAALDGDIVVSGCEMGGHPISAVLRQKAKTAAVIMSQSAAATIHHDSDRVKAAGISVVDDEEAEGLKKDPRYKKLDLRDLDEKRLKGIVAGFGVDFDFDVVVVCAQDHGVAPAGVSHLDFRHNLLRDRLEKDPRPQALLYAANRIPAALNRLSAIAADGRSLPASEVFVMDSGMAAILGASKDPQAMDQPIQVVLDVATSHTVVAALKEGEICGFFEYHTHDMTPAILEDLLPKLAQGLLEHKTILAAGGHGAYIRKSFRFDEVETIIATGPKRNLIRSARLPLSWGAPLGDNMMTGTLGLLTAVRAHQGLDGIDPF